MTTTAIRCSGCNTRFRVRLHESPRNAKCPRCGSALQIPSLAHGAGLQPATDQPRSGLVGNLPHSAERQESEDVADCWTGPTDDSDPVLDRVLRRNQPRRSEWRGPLLVAVPILLVTVALWFVTTRPPGRDLIWSIPPGSSLSSTGQTPSASNVPGKPVTAGPLAARSASTRAPHSIASLSDLAIVKEPMNDIPTEAEEPAEDTPAADAPTTEGSPAKTDAAACSPTSAKSPKEVLDQPVGQDFTQTRIQEVVDYLTDSTGVTFQLDMKSLWYDQGTTRNVPVTLKAEQMPIRDFLEQVVVKQLKAVYIVHDDKIVITSRKAANKTATPDKH